MEQIHEKFQTTVNEKLVYCVSLSPVKLALFQTTLLMRGKEKSCLSHSYFCSETWQVTFYPEADYCLGKNKNIPVDSAKCPNVCALLCRPRASQRDSGSWKMPSRIGTALPTGSQIKTLQKLTRFLRVAGAVGKSSAWVQGWWTLHNNRALVPRNRSCDWLSRKP